MVAIAGGSKGAKAGPQAAGNSGGTAASASGQSAAVGSERALDAKNQPAAIPGSLSDASMVTPGSGTPDFRKMFLQTVIVSAGAVPAGMAVQMTAGLGPDVAGNRSSTGASSQISTNKSGGSASQPQAGTGVTQQGGQVEGKPAVAEQHNQRPDEKLAQREKELNEREVALSRKAAELASTANKLGQVVEKLLGTIGQDPTPSKAGAKDAAGDAKTAKEAAEKEPVSVDEEDVEPRLKAVLMNLSGFLKAWGGNQDFDEDEKPATEKPKGNRKK